MSQKALITGIAGQDGAYLAALLVQRGYEVHGLVRWDSHLGAHDGLARLAAMGLESAVAIHTGDVTDAANMAHLVCGLKPDEIYNLAGLSHVKVSFDTPRSALDINVVGTMNMLEAIRIAGLSGSVRFYQASSSEMFGSAPAPQNEETPMWPCSPYGVAKLAAYHLTKTYRESYGIFACNGILFNHESPLRGEDFVTRKITRAVAEMEAGRQEPLRLGNLNALRDWGDARDYVEGMWLMLQADAPDDYVLATGRARSVRDCVERAFAQIGIPILWRGQDLDEVGVHARTGRVLVEVDAAFFRPNEVTHLLGDADKAFAMLGWQAKRSFEDLIGDMVNEDRRLLRMGQSPLSIVA